jgi:hypothetical protein
MSILQFLNCDLITEILPSNNQLDAMAAADLKYKGQTLQGFGESLHRLVASAQRPVSKILLWRFRNLTGHQYRPRNVPFCRPD